MDDKEIPHRHKVREGILVQFKREFSKLKLELSVRLTLPALFQHVLTLTAICGEN
jgi:hypothetical protein